MKKTVLLIVLSLCAYINSYAQATSLTVDCQNPGWLSNLIPYGDQQTVKNLRVTGYIDGIDMAFISTLINKRKLKVIDLEEAHIVAGGDITSDNNLKGCHLWASDKIKRINKIIFPNSLKNGSNSFIFYGNTKSYIDVDSVIWTSDKISLNEGRFYADNWCHNTSFLQLPNGLTKIKHLPSGIKIVFPATLNYIENNGSSSNLIVYSYIEDPQSISLIPLTAGYAVISNSVFYIPKGTQKKYENSNLGKNNNTFIEFYDLDSVIVDTSIITLYKGDSDSIKTTIYPDAELVSYINYFNSDPSVAAIDSKGEVTALNCGETEITITPNVFIDGLETKSTTCLIKVFDHTEGVEIDSVEYIHIGEHITIGARTLPLGTSDNQIILTSSNDDVITINEKGELVGIGKGTCIITATSVDGKYTAQCEVTVIKAVEDVSLEIHQISMNPEESRRLLANVSPYDADNKKVLWSSSDETVATVDESGLVTAVNSGEAWIKAVSDDNPEACDSCKVTVTQAVTGIELDITECTLNKIGETIQLTAKVIPENANNRNVNWKSSNESVCFVSNGKVVAVGFGTAVIIATTEEGGFMAICTVKVEEASTLKGDVNTDGKVDISDVVAIINTMAGDTIFKATSDVNADGKTDISDVVSVINIMAGATE